MQRMSLHAGEAGFVANLEDASRRGREQPVRLRTGGSTTGSYGPAISRGGDTSAAAAAKVPLRPGFQRKLTARSGRTEKRFITASSSTGLEPGACCWSGACIPGPCAPAAGREGNRTHDRGCFRSVNALCSEISPTQIRLTDFCGFRTIGHLSGNQPHAPLQNLKQGSGCPLFTHTRTTEQGEPPRRGCLPAWKAPTFLPFRLRKCGCGI